MLAAHSIVVKDSPELLKMMEDSLAIYDQTLYYQRQEFFKGRDTNSKYKIYSYKELWDIVKNDPKYKDSKLDIEPKNYAIRKAVKNGKSYLYANKDFLKNPKKYLGKPK